MIYFRSSVSIGGVLWWTMAWQFGQSGTISFTGPVIFPHSMQRNTVMDVDEVPIVGDLSWSLYISPFVPIKQITSDILLPRTVRAPMKISTRLASGFGLLILLFILCTGISLHALWQARDGMNDTVNNKMKRYTLVLDMRGGLRDTAIAVRNLALLSDPAQMQPEWQRLVAQREA